MVRVRLDFFRKFIQISLILGDNLKARDASATNNLNKISLIWHRLATLNTADTLLNSAKLLRWVCCLMDQKYCCSCSCASVSNAAPITWSAFHRITMWEQSTSQLSLSFVLSPPSLGMFKSLFASSFYKHRANDSM